MGTILQSASAMSSLAEQAMAGGRGVFVGLLSLRVAAIFLMTPLLYAAPMPPTVRVLLVMGLSVAIAAGFPAPAALPSGWGQILSGAMAELVLGATLGLGILLAFGAFSIAGQLLDVQIGFGIAHVVDPVTQRPVPILTSAFQHVAVLVFFLVDGHHALLRGIAYSVAHLPVGMPWAIELAVGPVLQQAAGLFTLGFALAAPVVFSILLVEFALGVVARNLPQMNMFTMGIPVKIIAGLVALSLWFTGMGGVMTRAYAGIASTWDQFFTAAALAPQGAAGMPGERR